MIFRELVWCFCCCCCILCFIYIIIEVRVIMFNVTFNNISWLSVFSKEDSIDLLQVTEKLHHIKLYRVNPSTIRSCPRLPCYCTFCIMVLQVYANYVYLFFAVVIIIVSVVLLVLCIVVMIAYCRIKVTILNI
jgi:hypothetical protein